MESELLINYMYTFFTHNNKSHLKDGRFTIHKPITVKEIAQHLKGESRCGVFPIIDKAFTTFFVFDIDTENKEICAKIYNQLTLDGFHPSIEKSKSKGFHIWVFLIQKTSCLDIRRYMKWVLSENSLSQKKIDIFPRQDKTSDENPTGNGINLPLFGLFKNTDTASTRFLNANLEVFNDQQNYFYNLKRSEFNETHLKPCSEVDSVNSVPTEINCSQEIETLEKLMVVSKKSSSIRNNVLKAKKETRSERDLVYSKHLAELLFSPELIKYEIEARSNKYNDSNLRGQSKKNYLNDKTSQFSHIAKLFHAKASDHIVQPSAKMELFKHLDEDNAAYLTTKKSILKKFGKIDEQLLDWLEVDFHRVMMGDYYAISTGCGGGKSNVIKQLCSSIWAYNKVKFIPNVNTLICVERIEDGIYLEKVANAMRPLKIILDEDNIKDLIDRKTVQEINDYTDDVFSTNILTSIDETIKFETIDNKIRLNRMKDGSSYDDMIFRCAPSGKICLNGYTEADFNKNVCSICTKYVCPAHPTRLELIQNASVAISTHQALMRSNEWGTIRVDTNRKNRQLLLIDEKPEALKSTTMFLSKHGNYFKSSIDSLVSYLREHGHNELYTEINDNFLKKLKELYSKAKFSHSNLNSGNQSYDIYKSYAVPVISIKNKARLVTLKQSIWQNIDSIESKRNLSDLIESLLLLNGKEDSIISFGKRGTEAQLRIEIITNQWNKITPHENSATIIFDATANIDPSYLTSGAPVVKNISTTSDLSFPNLKLIFYTNTDITKGKVTKDHCDKLFSHLHSTHINSKILITHSKENSDTVQKSIESLKDSANFYNDHFNNLKGKNSYINCNVIAFTNLLRRTEANYLLIAQEIYKSQSKLVETDYRFKVPSNWSLKRGVGQLTNLSDSTFVFNDEFIDNVRTSIDVVDIIQTIFRISLRKDYTSTNYVYLPIASSGLLKKIIHYFKGADVTRIEI